MYVRREGNAHTGSSPENVQRRSGLSFAGVLGYFLAQIVFGISLKLIYIDDNVIIIQMKLPNDR